MLKQKTQTLTAVFSEVLANLAFMFTDDEAAPGSPQDVWLETTIDYRGPVNGQLRFFCTEEFAKMLAANLLGIDAEDENAEDKARDAARELMNIVCGQFVTSMYSEDDLFDLTIPETRELYETPDLDRKGTAEVCTLSVEGAQIHLAHQTHVGDKA